MRIIKEKQINQFSTTFSIFNAIINSKRKVYSLSFSKRSKTIHEVQEILEIIDVGVTFPIRCRFDDGIIAVVKYMKNRRGIRTLINEWIGSSIADAVGLSIPPYGLCNLSEAAILNSDDRNSDNELTADNAGLSFYTQNLSRTVRPDPFLLSRVSNHETELVILFDLVINNQDRHIGNVLVEMCSKPQMYFIDNSECLGPEISLEKMWDRKKSVYELLCSTVGFSEKQLSSEAIRIQETLTMGALAEIRSGIPALWTDKVPKAEMDQIFFGLQDRLSNLEQLSRDVAAFRRNRDE